VLRGHSKTRGSTGVEIFGDTTLHLDGAEGPITARFERPLVATGTFYAMTVETALVWDGDVPLHVTVPPTLFCRSGPHDEIAGPGRLHVFVSAAATVVAAGKCPKLGQERKTYAQNELFAV
jgi:hypothetical protein